MTRIGKGTFAGSRFWYTWLIFLLTFCHRGYGQSHGLDRSALEELTEDRTRNGVRINRFLSHSMEYFSLTPPAVMALTGEIGHNHELIRNAVYVGESIAFSAIITTATKEIVKRPRPFIADPMIIPEGRAGSYSFPSGHSSQAFSTATSLALICPRWYVVAPAFLWAGAVAYSRMYLGVHYPSDIAAGALFGTASAWVMFKVNKCLQRRNHADRPQREE